MRLSEKCLKEFEKIEEYLLSEDGEMYFNMVNKHSIPTLKKIEVDYDPDENDEIS